MDMDFDQVMSIAIPVGVVVAFCCCACYGIHRKKQHTKVTPDFV